MLPSEYQTLYSDSFTGFVCHLFYFVCVENFKFACLKNASYVRMTETVNSQRPLLLLLPTLRSRSQVLCHKHSYRLLDNIVVECWLRMREVPGSIPSQGSRHIKDVIKMVTCNHVVNHDIVLNIAVTKENKQLRTYDISICTCCLFN